MRRKKVCWSSSSRHTKQKSSTPTTDGIWKILWRSIMESPNFNTSSIRDKWHRWESRSTSKRRYFSSIATMRSGWKMVVLFYGMLLFSANCPRLYGKTPYERRFGEPVKGPIIPFGAMVECHPISARRLSRIHLFGKKVSLGIFLGFELIAERIWKWDILIADFEDFEKLDASEIYLPRANATEVLITQKEDEFIFPVADGTAKLSGGDNEFREPTQSRQPTVRIEHFSRELRGELGESQPTESTDDAEARADFWSIQRDFSVVITMNLEFNSTCRRKKHPPFHWNTLTRQGLLVLICMSRKKNGSMIIGM